jgi:hypothetical protein
MWNRCQRVRGAELACIEVDELRAAGSGWQRRLGRSCEEVAAELRELWQVRLGELREQASAALGQMVYFGPFEGAERACAARSDGPPDAYVKTLNLDLPFDHEVACS